MGGHVLVQDMDVTGNTSVAEQMQREDDARRHTPGENRGRKESNLGDAENTIKKLLTSPRIVSEQVHQVAPLPAA